MKGAPFVPLVDTPSARISRWARRYLLAGGGFLVLSQLVALTGGPLQAEYTFGLLGFVLLTIFGKAFSLVPAYFARQLSFPRAPMVALPLLVGGALFTGIGAFDTLPHQTAPFGAGLWAVGVGVTAGTLLATIGDNLTGAETGTSGADEDRHRLDRFANCFVPVAFGYLLLGTYELLALETTLPALVGGPLFRPLHLLGAGFALLALFSIGFRLLPRFLATTPLAPLALVVLPAAALGPLLVAIGYPDGLHFRAGGTLLGVAMLGFAIAYLHLFVVTDRDRVGFYGPLFGVFLGTGGIALGVFFALHGIDAGLTSAHVRLNVFGLFGLLIVGVAFQFYPPAIGQWPGAGDRLALVTIATLAAGVALAGLSGIFSLQTPLLGRLGSFLALLGGCGYLYLLGAAMGYQRGR